MNSLQNIAYLVRSAVLLAFLGVLGMIIPLGVLGGAYTDSFETYDLGELNGQGGWIGDETIEVQDLEAFEGTKAITIKNTSANIRKFGVEVSDGKSIVYFYFGSGSSDRSMRFYISKDSQDQIQILIYASTMKVKYYLDGWVEFGTFSFDTWYSLETEWRSSDGKVRYCFNEGSWTNWVERANYTEGYSPNKVLLYFVGTETYFDYVSVFPPFPPYIEVISPVSASTITDLFTDIVIDYYYLKPADDFDGISFAFIEDKLRTTSDSYYFDELDESGDGQITISLSEFLIDTNAKYFFQGLGFGSEVDITGGMFITTMGGVSYFTENLVIDDYYLIFNVEGLAEPYTFTEPETWYSINVERYATSTPMFENFVGFISPIFEKVGGFGTKIAGMFDTNEAYDRGYSLGEIFPIAEVFIKKIDMFFGGFPLMSFLKYIILVMLGIFVIRAVMKFVPFF